MTHFDDLGPAEQLLRATSARGYINPTPIRTKVVAALAAGGDVIGIAQSGIVKTTPSGPPLPDRTKTVVVDEADQMMVLGCLPAIGEIMTHPSAPRRTVPVTADVAARGIDIDDVTHAIGFELPDMPGAHVHRIGRTAQAGRAVSSCGPSERKRPARIERLVDTRLPRAANGGKSARPATDTGRETGEDADKSLSGKKRRCHGAGEKPKTRSSTRPSQGQPGLLESAHAASTRSAA
ncbi:MAG: helicase-related protein [Pseudomonadota bacterium]